MFLVKIASKGTSLIGEFEQSDSVKETNDFHNRAFYQNAARVYEKSA